MATKAWISKQAKRQETINRNWEKRQELKKEGDRAAMARMDRDSSLTRSKSRCQITGRSRGYLRKFNISRVMLRELALKGHIPGLKKSSW
jgi:small subunit ribosomal protein S14